MANSNPLMDIIQSNISEGLIDQLAGQLGGADRQQTAIAASGIMNTLLQQLSRNAASPEGAQSLNNALERDHDGSILNDIVGMLGGQSQQAGMSRALNGAGILNHILGDRQSGVAQMVSQMSGMDQSKTGSLMTMLAPVLLGALGKTKRQQGLDASGLASLLNGAVTTQKQNQQSGEMDLISRFLDADGDGSIMDDVANIGMKFLGGFLRKR